MDLINREAVKKDYMKKVDLYAGPAMQMFLLAKLFDCAPTVDAEPVRHGRWISWLETENYIPSEQRHECSVCHDAAQVLIDGNGLELLSPYCPNCGAKMYKPAEFDGEGGPHV